MASRKKNLLAGGPKKPSNASTLTMSSTADLNGSVSTRSSSRGQKTISSFFAVDDAASQPPAKKQKSVLGTSMATRSSPRKNPANLTQSTLSQFVTPEMTSPLKSVAKPRRTTPIPDVHVQKNTHATDGVARDNSVIDEEDSRKSSMDGVLESRAGTKRRTSTVLNEALNKVKKMKIAAPLLEEPDPVDDLDRTISIRATQPGKSFKKQGRAHCSSVSQQRISTQQMLVYKNPS